MSVLVNEETKLIVDEREDSYLRSIMTLEKIDDDIEVIEILVWEHDGDSFRLVAKNREQAVQMWKHPYAYRQDDDAA